MPIIKDLTGQRFGNLIAVRRLDERKNGKIVWECKCDCGNMTQVRSGSLLNGGTKSCGCTIKKNLIGKRFGKLTVIEETTSRKGTSVVWKCRCDCGEIALFSQDDLKRGRITSCGCDKIKRTVELIGMRFGKLTALHSTDRRDNRSVVWECRCDCGNIIYVSSVNLRNGSAVSCGCLRHKDLTGMRFGRLTVLHVTDKIINKMHVWKCRCDCGNVVDVREYCLLIGDTRSCGCLRRDISTEQYREHLSSEYVMGTCLRAIREDEQKIRSTNSTGVKGVFFDSSQNVYVATLTFQGRRITRRYRSLEEASDARRKMKQIHEEFLEWWDSLSEEERFKACKEYENEKSTQIALLRQRMKELLK